MAQLKVQPRQVTLDTDGTLAANSDTQIASQKATKTYADTKTTLAAVNAQKLSVFAATSSSELAGVISDETGSGLLVFATSPTLVTPTTNNLTLSGNISSAAWTTSGIKIKGTAATLTDTSSSGTVALAYTSVLGGNTIAASSVTTFTNYAALYLNDPIAGSNVTLTNKWAFGADSARIGTSNQLTISNTGVLTATSPVLTTPNIGTPSAGVLTNATALPLTTGVTGVLPTANGGAQIFQRQQFR